MARERGKGSVYLLFSDLNAKYRFRAARFVQGKGYIPVYPTIMGDFFAIKEDRRKAIENSTALVRKCEEVWIFGGVDAGMQDQLTFARKAGKKVRHFLILTGEFWEREMEPAQKASG